MYSDDETKRQMSTEDELMNRAQHNQLLTELEASRRATEALYNDTSTAKHNARQIMRRKLNRLNGIIIATILAQPPSHECYNLLTKKS